MTRVHRGAGLNLDRARKPVASARATNLEALANAVCNLKICGELRRSEEISLRGLLRGKHWAVCERARVVLAGIFEREGLTPSTVTAQRLHSFLRDPALLPPSTDLQTFLQKGPFSPWSQSSGVVVGPHPFLSGTAKAWRVPLHVGRRVLSVFLPIAARHFEVRALTAENDPRRSVATLKELALMLAAQPRDVLERIERVDAEPRVPPTISSDRRGMESFVHVREQGCVHVLPLPKALPSPARGNLLADPLLFAICRQEGIDRWGAGGTGPAWDVYRDDRMLDHGLAPSVSALRDVVTDFGETRALWYLLRDRPASKDIQAVMPAHWRRMILL